MEFYIYLVLIVLFLSLVKRANNKVVYIGVAFALFFLAAYRSLGVGTDSEAYFPVGDIAALAQKLQQNIDAPYRQKEYPMEKYDWDAIAGQTAAVYEKCAKPRPER